MKCGKSTFLNAFVFEDDVLPAATTPMTAALSVIKYGEEKKIEAEFYSEDEWAEQQIQAKRNLSEIENELEISKVKAAKELVLKATNLGDDVSRYLGKTQSDIFENLIDYVGADGKYVSITKSVTIYYPKDYLKGIEIVDTPGFNDPIVSREERTKDFLKRADVVILMLYAGRAFDAEDKNILFQKVRSCGIGKVIIGINKYDILFCDENSQEYGDVDGIVQYVKKEINNSCNSCGDTRLNDIIQDVTPIPMGAEMALLSRLPMSKIHNNENYSFHWNDYCKKFGISTQEEMWKLSRIDNMTSAIIQMVEKEKWQILFEKPKNSILAAGHKVLEDIQKKLSEYETTISMYSLPDDELEELQDNLNKAPKKIGKKISNWEETLNDVFQDGCRKIRIEMEDIVDKSAKNLNRIIDDWGRFQDVDVILPSITNELDQLSTRHLKRCMEDNANRMKQALRSSLNDFFANVVDTVIIKYLPDLDYKDVINEAKRRIQMDIVESLFSVDPNNDDEEQTDVWDWVHDFLKGFTYGLLPLVENAINHDEIVKNLKTHIGNLSSQFDANEYLQPIYQNQNSIIESVREVFQKEFLQPVQEQYNDVVNNLANRESSLEDAKKKKEEQLSKCSEVKKQLAEVESTFA